MARLARMDEHGRVPSRRAWPRSCGDVAALAHAGADHAASRPGSARPPRAKVGIEGSGQLEQGRGLDAQHRAAVIEHAGHARPPPRHRSDRRKVGQCVIWPSCTAADPRRGSLRGRPNDGPTCVPPTHRRHALGHHAPARPSGPAVRRRCSSRTMRPAIHPVNSGRCRDDPHRRGPRCRDDPASPPVH